MISMDLLQKTHTSFSKIQLTKTHKDQMRKEISVYARAAHPDKAKRSAIILWPVFAGIAAAIGVVMFGIQMSKQSMPGSVVYPVKRMIEETAVVVQQKNRQLLRQKQLDDRLQELSLVFDTNDAHAQDVAVSEIKNATVDLIAAPDTDVLDIRDQILMYITHLQERIDDEEKIQKLEDLKDVLRTLFLPENEEDVEGVFVSPTPTTTVEPTTSPLIQAFPSPSASPKSDNGKNEKEPPGKSEDKGKDAAPGQIKKQ